MSEFNFELFKKRLNIFLEKIEDFGGETDPLTIEKPATEEEIKAVEAKLGYTLPAHLREVLLENTAHLEFYWNIKTAFHQVGNGDYIAIELEPENYGKVVYLSHDGSENHGLYIADNFKEFLMNYAAVGCTGGEDWQWQPFYTKGKGIDPTCKNARNWYKILNIDPASPREAAKFTPPARLISNLPFILYNF